MLFKQSQLSGIKSGSVTLAFRKWKKSKVRNGSIINTSSGQIEILNIAEIQENEISNEEAILAGYENKSQLSRFLNAYSEGILYKISVRYHSEDPRISLSQSSDLTSDDIAHILQKMKRLDLRSSRGKWTLVSLQMIQKHPKLKAQLLSELLEFPKDQLKINIRKLKNMGLTISHSEGYTISPRGEIILEHLEC